MENIRTTLFNTVKQVLDEKKYTYKSDENDTFLTYKIRYNNLIDYVVTYMIDTYDDGIRIIAELPIGAATDDPKIRNIYEYLCRVNMTFYHGFFEMDNRDGTLRYREFFKCYDKPYDAKTIDDFLLTVSHCLGKHFLGLFNVLVNDTDPAEAVRMCIDPHYRDDDELEETEFFELDTDIFGDEEDSSDDEST